VNVLPSTHHAHPFVCGLPSRVLYVTHDVTQLLNRTGINAVGVMLGGGWYGRFSIAFWCVVLTLLPNN
jgi:hypothetical protein